MDYEAGRLLRANKVDRYKNEENGDWKFLIWDELSDSPKTPGGTVGHRWGTAEGKWNLEFKDPIGWLGNFAETDFDR